MKHPPIMFLLALLLAVACVACSPSRHAEYPSESYSADQGGYSAGAESEELAPMESAGGGGLFDEVYEPASGPGGSGDRARTVSRPPPAQANRDSSKSTGVTQTAQADDAGDPNTSAGVTTGKDAKRVIIYTARLVIGVLEIPPAIDSMKQLTEEYEGWVQASDSVSIVVRIPAPRFNDFLRDVRELGRVDQESVQGKDVTEEYLDLEIRLQNAMELRERYVALLEKAESVKDALAIETELGRLTGEIERLKGRIRFLGQHAAYSTVTVTFQQRAEVSQQAKNHVRLPFSWLRTYNLSEVYRNRSY